jgi:hypothetical protein
MGISVRGGCSVHVLERFDGRNPCQFAQSLRAKVLKMLKVLMLVGGSESKWLKLIMLIG